MTTLISDLERTLFFTDVPDGALTRKPITQPSAAGLEQALSNFGKDVENTLFFNDLESIAPEKRKGNPKKEHLGDPKKAFQTLDAYRKDETTPTPFDDDDNENPIQTKARGMTIPPPAMSRLQKQYEDKVLAEKQAKLLLEDISEAKKQAELFLAAKAVKSK